MKKIYTRPTLQALKIYNQSLLTDSGETVEGYGDRISTEDAPGISNSSGPWQ